MRYEVRGGGAMAKEWSGRKGGGRRQDFHAKRVGILAPLNDVATNFVVSSVLCVSISFFRGLWFIRLA